MREYWVDVETIGRLDTSLSEELNETYVIVDDNDCELPAPALGKTTTACLELDGDDTDEDEDEDESEDQEEPTTKKKTKKGSKGTPSPKSRRRSILRKSGGKTRSARKAAKAKEEEIEAALEASYLVLQMYLA